VNKLNKKRDSKLRSKIDRNKRRIGALANLTIGLTLFTLLSTFYLVYNKTGAENLIVKPTIALVNEDRDGAFNETTYNFGKVFVNRVSHDNKYNWQVISRPVADRAYDDGSVQAVIYLPQNFTQNILTLQAINPQNAEVDYKVLTSQSELNNQMLQNKIVDVLHDFNTSIVKMYYGSVAGNVANAQTSMNKVVTAQDEILSDLARDVYEPFQTTDQFYSAVVNVSNGLKAQNEAWIQAQNSFTTAVVNTLTTTSHRFAHQLPHLTNYFETQKNIVGLNVENANESIADQAKADYNHYYDQYTNAYGSFATALRQLKSRDEAGNEAGLFNDVEHTMTKYQDVISRVRDNLGQQTKSLIERQQNLLALEQQLYRQFFNKDVNPTVDEIDFTSVETDDNAKAAIAKLIAKSFSKRENLKDSNYQRTIADLIKDISVDETEYKQLLDTLEKNGSMTTTQRKSLLTDLTILNNYATKFDLPTATVNFNDAPTSNTTDQFFAKQLTIVVPAGKKYELTLQKEDETNEVKISSIFVIDDHGANQIIEASKPVTLDNTKPNDKAEYEINGDNAQTIEREVIENTQSSDHVTSPLLQPKTFVITYQVSLGKTEKAIVKTQWGEVESKDNESVDIFGLMPAQTVSAYAGGQQFSYITELMSKIKTASQLITFLYGAPGATPKDMIKVTDFAERADAQSIYAMYGNMDERPIAEQISEEDIVGYRTLGSENIRRVRETLDALKTTIAQLKEDEQSLSAKLPIDYFAHTTLALNNWHRQTMEAIDAQYATWTSNETELLVEKPWTGYIEGERALYYDQIGGQTLYDTISELIETSATQATDTANSSKRIEDNTETFTTMVDTVMKTQDEAKGVIENTASLLSEGVNSFSKSQDYAEKFATVLANTREVGVDSNKIFSFFAHPLVAKNMTIKVAEILPIFDWQPWLIFAIGLFSGLFVMRLGRTIKWWLRK